MQDNNPKHVSKLGQEYLTTNNINWWRTPPDLPDMNLIENLWNEMKEYLQREIKPKTKDELITGIEQFWDTVTGD